MASLKRDFTEPIICDSNPNDWFIFFRYFHNGQWVTRKYREGINLIKDKRERKKEAEALLSARKLWLQSGWNPILDPKFEARNSAGNHDYANLKNLSLTKGLEFALEKKSLAKKSRHDYNTMVKYIKQAALNCRLSELPIIALRRVHVKALIEEAKRIRNWSNHSYNKNLDFLSSMLTDLVEWEVLEFNPALKMQRLVSEDAQKFVPLTEEEKCLIREYIPKKNKYYFVFLMTLYYTGIRPKEILGLQIADLDQKEELFRLKPYNEKTKTKKARTCVINKYLLGLYKELRLEKYPNNWCIFSEGFEPGEKRIERKVATDLWDDLVRTQLGIDKFMYGLKHTGADDLVEAAKKKGIKKDQIEEIVQANLGHTSKFMTRRYTQKGIQISQGIIRNIATQF